MKRHRSLTHLVHELLSTHIKPGGKAVDATMGNGHDTLFLAKQVGHRGGVHAFDIQTQAIEQTHMRLQAKGQLEQARLHPCGHQHLLEKVPDDWRGATDVVTFNLGYLPGGEKAVTTQPGSTLLALEQASQLLKVGGKLSVLAYRGHAGGQAETDQVLAWLEHQPNLRLDIYESPGPVLLMATKQP